MPRCDDAHRRWPRTRRRGRRRPSSPSRSGPRRRRRSRSHPFSPPPPVAQWSITITSSIEPAPYRYVVRVRAIATCAASVSEAMFHKQALVRGGSVCVGRRTALMCCCAEQHAFPTDARRCRCLTSNHDHHKTNPRTHRGGSIRPDSLAQLLAYGNAHAGCTAMVLDGFSGLLLGAVLERMGGACVGVHACVCVRWLAGWLAGSVGLVGWLARRPPSPFQKRGGPP